jgi:hypothetical protein
MTQSFKGGFLRDDTTGALAVTGGAAGGAVDLPTVLANDDLRMGVSRPVGAVAMTIVDATDLGNTVTPTISGATGTMRVAGGTGLGMYIPAGKIITNINVLFSAAGTAPTNHWMCILRVSDRVPMATTQDKTTTVISTGVPVAYRIASTLGGAAAGSWTCPAAAFYALGFVFAGTAAPSLVANGTISQPASQQFNFFAGNSSAGLTVPISSAAAVTAPSGGGSAFFAYAT